MNPPRSRPKQNISLKYWHLLGRWWRKTHWASPEGSSCLPLPPTTKKKSPQNKMKSDKPKPTNEWNEPIKITHREISVLLNILSQRLANYDQCTISGLPSVFCKCSFIGTKPHPFIYVLSRAVLILTQLSWVAETRTVWLQSQKYLPSGPFQKKYTDPATRYKQEENK